MALMQKNQAKDMPAAEGALKRGRLIGFALQSAGTPTSA